MNYLLSFIIGYLLGNINPAYIYGKIKGIDIREHGSNNAGASNTKIMFGWTAGVIIALLDIFKSFLAFYLCKKIFNDDIFAYLGGAGAVMGHIFPFYMNFKGGKGYASYTGMLFGIDYRLAIAMILYGIIITFLTNYIVVSTLSTVIIVPIYLYFIGTDLKLVIIMIIIGMVIIYKHKINLIRLKNHEEMPLRKKK